MLIFSCAIFAITRVSPLRYYIADLLALLPLLLYAIDTRYMPYTLYSFAFELFSLFLRCFAA